MPTTDEPSLSPADPVWYVSYGSNMAERRLACYLSGGTPPGAAGWRFGWPELRTAGEFDGRVKYGRLLRPGQNPGDAVFAEKRREDDLRAERLSVVRWTWADLDRFEPVAARLRRGFAT